MEIAGIAIWANPPPYRANSHQDLPSLVHSHSHLGRPATLMRALKGVPRATLYSVSSHSRVGSTSGAGKSYIKNIRQGLEKKLLCSPERRIWKQKNLTRTGEGNAWVGHLRWGRFSAFIFSKNAENIFGFLLQVFSSEGGDRGGNFSDLFPELNNKSYKKYFLKIK